MDSTTPNPNPDGSRPDAGAVDALIEIRLTIAAQIGRLRELADRRGDDGAEIDIAADHYETGDVWMASAIELAAQG